MRTIVRIFTPLSRKSIPLFKNLVRLYRHHKEFEDIKGQVEEIKQLMKWSTEDKDDVDKQEELTGWNLYKFVEIFPAIKHMITVSQFLPENSV